MRFYNKTTTVSRLNYLYCSLSHIITVVSILLMQNKKLIVGTEKFFYISGKPQKVSSNIDLLPMTNF